MCGSLPSAVRVFQHFTGWHRAWASLSLKYLGVCISADLTWSKHIMLVTCKARRLLGYIFRSFSPHCSPSAIMTLYRAQVLPLLNYGCIIWDPQFKKDSALLESVQLFAARMANKSWNANAVSLNSKLNLSTLSSDEHTLVCSMFLRVTCTVLQVFLICVLIE